MMYYEAYHFIPNFFFQYLRFLVKVIIFNLF